MTINLDPMPEPCDAHQETCFDCPDCTRNYQQEYYRQRIKPGRQARRRRRAAQHRCTYCGRPLDTEDPHQQCADCRAYFTGKQGEFRARRRTEQDSNARNGTAGDPAALLGIEES